MWKVKKEDGTLYFNIPNPGNSDVSVNRVNNASYNKMVDGSIARFSPAVVSNYEPITFEITGASYTRAVENNINTTIDGSSYVVLQTHEGQCFYGYFDDCRKSYLLSGRTQVYNLQVKFTVMCYIQ